MFTGVFNRTVVVTHLIYLTLLLRRSSALKRSQNLRIAATPAQMPLHSRPNLGLAWSRLFVQESDHSHNHSRSAITALERAFGEKCLLHRVRLAVRRETLDGKNCLFVSVADRCDARGDAFAS